MDETTDVDPVGAVLGRLVGDFGATTGTLLMALGLRVGLWDALAEGPGSVEDVAARAGVAPPYAREWLRAQATAGYVLFDATAGDFALAPGVDVALAGPLRGSASGVCDQLAVWWAEIDRYDQAFRARDGHRLGRSSRRECHGRHDPLGSRPFSRARAPA